MPALSDPDFSKLTSYPPITTFGPVADIKPRPLLPLTPPPLPSTLPSLPSPTRQSPLGPSWTLTSHLLPAAYPRTTPDIHVSPPVFSPDKEEWKQRVAGTLDELIALKAKLAKGELAGLEGSKKLLWIMVDRIARTGRTKDNEAGGKKGVTLFFAHANGFNQETWYPALQHLIKSISATVDIAEIWLWQAVNHGDAGIINAPNLCGIYDWQDNARDMLQFLLYYMPLSTVDVPPTHLLRLPESIAQSRKWFGFQARHFVAVGHSYGGCSIALAAVNYPSLFSSIIFVDPMIRVLRPNQPLATKPVYRNVSGALSRRAQWSSKDEARRLFLKSSFFQAWDPAVLDAYIEYGLIKDDKSGGVKLKMSGFQEAVVFSESLTSYETWILLDRINENIELKWIMPGKVPPEERTEKQELVWRRPRNSSNVVIHPADHLIPHQAPKELALHIASFLEYKYGTRPPASRL